MTKRTPKSAIKKRSPEFQKRLAAFKTSVPLLLTLLLLGAVYLFVLLPETPENSLKKAILNTTDTNKYTAVRYDGSFGDSNRSIAGEFTGQKSSNGDSEFRVKFKTEEKSTSFETKRIGTNTYIMLSGVENFDLTIGVITGAKKPTIEQRRVLLAVQNKWIKLSEAQTSQALTVIPCLHRLPGSGVGTVASGMSEENYPFKLTGGPYDNKDDSEDETYEATLTHDENLSGPERFTYELVNCLETEYAQDDFRLRGSTKADLSSQKFTFTVDPLSSTVKRMVVKQVGQYFSINLRDFNKDITVSSPENSVELVDLYETLSAEDKAFLLTIMQL